MQELLGAAEGHQERLHVCFEAQQVAVATSSLHQHAYHGSETLKRAGAAALGAAERREHRFQGREPGAHPVQPGSPGL